MAGNNTTAIDVSAQRVAAVYARALLGATEQAGNTDQVVEQLDVLVRDVIGPQPALEQLMRSALITAEQKDRILDRTLEGRVSPTLLALLKVVMKNDRFGCLREIREETLRRYHQMRGRQPVTVRSATPLDEVLRGQLGDMLRRALGTEPKISEKTDPALIGGVVIEVGDTLYDASVATGLARLRDRMVESCIEQIETHRERFL